MPKGFKFSAKQKSWSSAVARNATNFNTSLRKNTTFIGKLRDLITYDTNYLRKIVNSTPSRSKQTPKQRAMFFAASSIISTRRKDKKEWGSNVKSSKSIPLIPINRSLKRGGQNITKAYTWVERNRRLHTFKKSDNDFVALSKRNQNEVFLETLSEVPMATRLDTHNVIVGQIKAQITRYNKAK